MISKFQKSELGKFISNFPLKHVIASTNNNEITNYMLVSTTLPCNSFETYQAKTSEAKKTKSSNDAKVILSIKIEDVLSKSQSLVRICEMFEKHFVECVTETEKKQNIKIISKANAVK